MSILQKLKFDERFPIVSRYGARGLVGSINFSISNLIQQHMRQSSIGTGAMPETSEGPTLEQYNELAAQQAGMEEEIRRREELGFVADLPPLILAERLKLIRDALQAELTAHAGLRPMYTNPAKLVADPFHIGADFRESFDFQVSMAPRINKAQVKAESLITGMPEEEIETMLLRQHDQRRNFLTANRAEIVAIYSGLQAHDFQNYPEALEDAEAVFGELPAMQRFRLAVGADKALYSGVKSEVQRHMRTRNAEHLANIEVLHHARREIRAEAGEWLAVDKFRRELEWAQQSGAELPVWGTAPPPAQVAEDAKAAFEPKRQMVKHA